MDSLYSNWFSLRDRQHDPREQRLRERSTRVVAEPVEHPQQHDGEHDVEQRQRAQETGLFAVEHVTGEIAHMQSKQQPRKIAHVPQHFCSRTDAVKAIAWEPLEQAVFQSRKEDPAMPYERIADLPKAQVDQYTRHRKEAFLKAFNNAYDQ